MTLPTSFLENPRVLHVDTTSTSKAPATEKHKSDPVEQDPQVAEALQEIFNAGAVSGGVTHINPVLQEQSQTLQKAQQDEAVNRYLSAVVQGIVQEIEKEKVVFEDCPTMLDDEQWEYRQKATPETLNLLQWCSNLLVVHYLSDVEHADDHTQRAFSVMVQKKLSKKMAEATLELTKLSPDFLKNLTELLPYQPYFVRHDLLTKQLAKPLIEYLKKAGS